MLPRAAARCCSPPGCQQPAPHGWEVFPGQAEAGDKFKPGRLLDDGVKSPWHCVFLDHQGPKIAPGHRSGAVDPISLPAVTRLPLPPWLRALLALLC